MPKFDLLEKTELRIERISLQGANLNDVAAVVAEVLGLPCEAVLVTDALDHVMTIDILRKSVDAYSLVGKRERLLQRLAQLPGVKITDDTSVCSEGMLGWIAMDEGPAEQALRRSEEMAAEILRNISKRVIVFSTGAEVAKGQITDTNTPAIMKCLESEGYKASKGPTLKDDKLLITAKLREAADHGGYGLIITTGGVGAEDKDHTVEALKALDPEAATPYICHFKMGTGRHVKDGVRIAVGDYNGTVIVSLPGPNDEVMASLNVLVEGLKAEQEKHMLAENIAAKLREILRKKISPPPMH